MYVSITIIYDNKKIPCQGPQELNALSVCALQYFANTGYAACATSLVVSVSYSNWY